MENRIIFCSDHITKEITLKEALKYSQSKGALLEVHSAHFKELLAQKDFKSIICIHPHWRNYSLSTDNDTFMIKSLNYLYNLINFIESNGIKYIIIHPEGMPANLARESRYINVLKSYEKISKYIKNKDVRILIENMPPARVYPPSVLPNYFIGEQLDELFPILKIDSKFNFIFDLGHFICGLNVYGNRELKSLKTFGKKLIYVHVHDNNGKINNHEPLKRKKSIDILKIIEKLYHPLYSLEIAPSFENIDKTIRNLKKIMNI
ncbi:MAG: sugar phosphate isomerase/epimerase family protein [Candidatus Helarchaeota archaeon]